VVVADHERERYLVAMLGINANWVVNVRAAEGRPCCGAITPSPYVSKRSSGGEVAH
jgi:hypothetical protein